MAAALPVPPSLESLSAAKRVSLFLDFDGTLVPIAPKPDAIIVPHQLAARLAALSERVGGRLALVSGRSLNDLERHCGTLAIARAGSHGASRVAADGERLGPAPKKLPQNVIGRLEDFATQSGLLYEAKAHGGALHYRAQPDVEQDVREFAVALADENGLVVKFGKDVAELVHPGADKAGAVRAFMAQEMFEDSIPIFVGDDVTDEDGFLAAAELGGFGVAVGERESAAAHYHLDSVAAVHQWLRL